MPAAVREGADRAPLESLGSGDVTCRGIPSIFRLSSLFQRGVNKPHGHLSEVLFALVSSSSLLPVSTGDTYLLASLIGTAQG